MFKIKKNIIVLLAVLTMFISPLKTLAKDNNYTVNIKSNFNNFLLVNNSSKKEIQGLKALLELAQKEDMKLLTPDFAVALQKTIDVAISIIDNPDGFEQIEIDKVEGELAKLLGNVQYDQVRELRDLVDQIDKMLAQISKYDLNIYTEASLRALNEPLAGAKVVLNSMSNDQAAAKRVYNKLNSAALKLRLIQPDSRNTQAIINEMTILIDQAENIKAYNYTSESYKLVKDAKNQAKALLDYQVYPIDTFRLATASLKSAIEKLDAVNESDQEKLVNLLEQVKQLDEALYTKESYAQLVLAIKLSEEALKENEDKDYITSLNLLQDKRNGLKKLSDEADKDETPDLIDPNDKTDEDLDIVNPAVKTNTVFYIAILLLGFALLAGLGYFGYLHKLKNKQDIE